MDASGPADAESVHAPDHPAIDLGEYLPDDPATSVSCGRSGVRCITTAAGRCYCWGGIRDDGSDDVTPSLVPFVVRVTSVASSSFGRLARDVNGRIWYWGWDSPGSQEANCVRLLPFRVVEVPVLVEGVFGVGRVGGSYGYHVAFGSISGVFEYSHAPLGTHDSCWQWVRRWPEGVVDAARSDNEICAVKADGAVECLDLGPLASVVPRTSLMMTVGRTPTRLWFVDEVEKIAMGRWGQCVIRRDRTLHCWGHGELGQLGVTNLEGLVDDRLGRLRPTRVSGLSDVRDVEFDNGTTLALTGDGTLWAWGQPRLSGINVAAPEGPCPGGGPPTCVTTPSRVVDVQDVAAFSGCDANGLCVVTRRGRVFCSGRWSGDGTATARISPVEVRWGL